MTTQDGEDIVQRGKPISSKTYIVGLGGAGEEGKEGTQKNTVAPPNRFPSPS